MPYLNIMTRIEGRPHDDLLTKCGYGGHPTLAFMNPRGEILGRPRKRTVASFEASLQAIHDLAALEQREASGEKVSEFDRFLLEYKLMKLRGARLCERGKSLRGLDAKQQATVDDIVLQVEVGDLVLQSLQGPEAVQKGGKRMLEILDSGKCPSMEADANAWSVLSRYADQVADADLLDRCAAGLRKHFADQQSMVRWADSLAAKARKLRGDK